MEKIFQAVHSSCLGSRKNKKVRQRTLTKLKLRFRFASRYFLWPAVYEQSVWLLVVTSVSSAQIKNNPWVWYSHNIPPIIEMSNINITKRGQQVLSW